MRQHWYTFFVFLILLSTKIALAEESAATSSLDIGLKNEKDHNLTIDVPQVVTGGTARDDLEKQGQNYINAHDKNQVEIAKAKQKLDKAKKKLADTKARAAQLEAKLKTKLTDGDKAYTEIELNRKKKMIRENESGDGSLEDQEKELLRMQMRNHLLGTEGQRMLDAAEAGKPYTASNATGALNRANSDLGSPALQEQVYESLGSAQGGSFVDGAGQATSWLGEKVESMGFKGAGEAIQNFGENTSQIGKTMSATGEGQLASLNPGENIVTPDSSYRVNTRGDMEIWTDKNTGQTFATKGPGSTEAYGQTVKNGKANYDNLYHVVTDETGTHFQKYTPSKGSGLMFEGVEGLEGTTAGTTHTYQSQRMPNGQILSAVGPSGQSEANWGSQVAQMFIPDADARVMASMNNSHIGGQPLQNYARVPNAQEMSGFNNAVQKTAYFPKPINNPIVGTYKGYKNVLIFKSDHFMPGGTVIVPRNSKGSLDWGKRFCIT